MRKCKWWGCERTCEDQFCSQSCGNKYRVDLRRREVKYRLVQLAGGRCVRCGYGKCIEALEFHHRDPSTKRFAFGSGDTPSWHILVEEVAKCDLLCSNCHREVESEPFRERWAAVFERVAERAVQAHAAARCEITAAERNGKQRQSRRRRSLLSRRSYVKGL